VALRDAGGDTFGYAPERAFPVIYADDVERSARFYAELGFEEHFRLPSDGEPGYVGLRRGGWELAVVTAESPQGLIGVEIGSKPRFEMFVYVADVDRRIEQLRGAGVSVLREPEDMFWGERVAWVADPDGNPVALAAGGGQD
jgi:lactoylglutathione lyase